MSDRNQKLLQKLIQEGSVSKEKLQQQLHLTTHQLTYSISVLNTQLTSKGLPKIGLQKGYYSVDPVAATYLADHQNIHEAIITPEERENILTIMLLTNDQLVSLNHICIGLQVSKNTALNDVKRLRSKLQAAGLKLESSRKSGYVVTGDEWQLRIYLLHAITKIYNRYGEHFTTELLSPWKSYIQSTRQKIRSVEKYLDMKYTDEDFYSLIYFISAVRLRVQHHYLINPARLKGGESEIQKTREYQAIFYTQDDFTKLPDIERCYITLQFLSANVRNRRSIGDELATRLSNALWEFLTEFESKAMIILPNKKDLLIKLTNHFAPSYYRIKFQMPVNNVLYNKITSKYEALHDFVKQSIGPLERFFGTTISDVEISYITLFIGGHLAGNEHADFEKKIIKAVILCPNGVSMSQLLYRTLQTTFPEFMFYPPSSLRDYDGFLLPHDLVFSTVPVISKKKVYVIADILNKQEQLKLRQKVLRDVYQVNFDGVQPQDILTVVKQYAHITDEKRLMDALSNLLLQPDASKAESTISKKGLLQLLSVNNIAVIDNASWAGVLDLAVEMLVRQNVIAQSYRLAIQRNYRDQPSYILLNQNIVLPHIDPDLFPQALGISLVIVRNGFTYGVRRVYSAALLTTPDKVSHLNLLYDINRLALDENLISQLAKLNTPEEVLQTITLFFHQR